jgi:glycine cleavage system aminomethyltransferase T
LSSSPFVVDGAAIPYEAGDTIADAMLRAGLHPGRGGCLCLAGDCPNCLVVVDGVSYLRACMEPARDGLEVERARAVIPSHDPPPVAVRHLHCELGVIGRAGNERRAITIDERGPADVVGSAVSISEGLLVVVRGRGETVHVHCDEVVVATGAGELQPACPGMELEGIFTRRAAERHPPNGRVVTVTAPDWPVRFEGSTRVEAVVIRGADGSERREPCDAVVLDLGRVPRDNLLRQGRGLAVTAVGAAAGEATLPPAPERGVVCRCADVTVDDLESVWERGFREMELLKRATLAGTGACQGGGCLPHLRAFIASRGGHVPPPFTARPLARPMTLAEAAAGAHFAPHRRTALDGEHRAAGAQMERFGGWWRPWTYGDTVGEYRAVREDVSICDVSTLGRMSVSGPDAVAALEWLYPCHVADIAPGRMRYALLLHETGYVIDDGLILRQAEDRFLLTFTTGGAAAAEAWVRDWSDGRDLRIADRTAALGAINVTGPRAVELLAGCGLDQPPAYMRHTDAVICGVPCIVMRLGFTGEASFELHHDADRSVELWRALHALGARPHGLDALMMLRLEKGHIIVGQDTDFDSTPRRLGMEWAQRMEKPAFIGRAALDRIDRIPLDRVLVGLEMDGEDAPREGEVLYVDHVLAGHVTSSRYSPVLGRVVMLGWIDLHDGLVPQRAACGGRTARVVPLPFYDREGARLRG